MMKRIILAGVLGGIAMFIWTSVAHMFTPLGEMGLREMPKEAAVLDALKRIWGTIAAFMYIPGWASAPMRQAIRNAKP